MPPRHRRTALRVRDGRVAKKNSWRLDPGDYRALPQADIRLDRRRPREGYRHLVTIAQLREFIELLPEWDEVAIGLDAILLDDHDDCMGWYQQGVVALCAWEHDLWWELCEVAWIVEHRTLLDRLDVPVRALTDEEVIDRVWGELRPSRRVRKPRGTYAEVCWSEAQARAFQLLHILPHELGHHHDRMTTRSRADIARGEPYAERYANAVFDALWPSCADVFAL